MAILDNASSKLAATCGIFFFFFFFFFFEKKAELVFQTCARPHRKAEDWAMWTRLGGAVILFTGLVSTLIQAVWFQVRSLFLSVWEGGGKDLVCLTSSFFGAGICSHWSCVFRLHCWGDWDFQLFFHDTQSRSAVFSRVLDSACRRFGHVLVVFGDL